MRALLLLTAAFAFSGCGLLYVEAQEEQLCHKQLTEQSFSAVPPLVLTLHQDFELPINNVTDSLPDPEHLKIHFYLEQLSFTVKDGVADFGGMEQISITMSPPAGSTQADVLLASYTKDPNNPAPKEIVMKAPPAAQQVDLMSYTDTAQKVKVTLDATGSLPNTDWTVVVGACAKINGHFNYADSLMGGGKK